MGLVAAIAGASGYAGGELLRLLLGHPGIELGALSAHTAAGTALTDAHPHLPQLAGRRFAETDPQQLADADVVFLALPHGESGAIAAALPDRVVVVDLGADHRLASAVDWARYYGGEHAGSWTYGLPELPGARAALTGARRIANPGCYPTATVLALAPLLAAGLVDPDDVVVVAASGTSGAGRTANPALGGSEVMGDLAAYKVAGHQHTPEIAQTLARSADRPVRLSFTTVLAPLPRGLLATCTARLLPGADEAALREALAAGYADEPFVHLLEPGRWPHTAATLGSNSCQLQVVADLDAGRAVVVAAIDNLGKGASGQAVQNANLALGFPEVTGLSPHGYAP